jgi:hypothetical protein
MSSVKRVLLGIGMGAILGIFCIIGVSQRIPSYVFNPTAYLLSAWYNRVIMGLIIGLAGDWKILKTGSDSLNAIIRGAILGAVVSAIFGLFGQTLEWMFMLAGIMFGIINDWITTRLAH